MDRQRQRKLAARARRQASLRHAYQELPEVIQEPAKVTEIKVEPTMVKKELPKFPKEKVREIAEERKPKTKDHVKKNGTKKKGK